MYLTKQMIEKLRAAYGTLAAYPVGGQADYTLRGLIKNLSSHDLRRLIAAEIKFIDTLATTELVRRGELPKDAQIDHAARKIAKSVTAQAVA